MEKTFKLWSHTQEVKVTGDLNDQIKKICNIDTHLFLLSTKNLLYHGRVITRGSTQEVCLELVEGLKLIDIDSCNKFLYGVDEGGRVFKYTEKFEVISEIKLIEEAKICVHGHIGMKRKLKVDRIAVGQYGHLYITDNGQLWASGKENWGT